MRVSLAFAIASAVASGQEEDSMMLQAKMTEIHDHRGEQINTKKKVARLSTELWCYRFCGENKERETNPDAVNCSRPIRATNDGHKTDLCARHCRRSDAWIEVAGRKCSNEDGKKDKVIYKFPKENSLKESQAACKADPDCGAVQLTPNGSKYSHEAVSSHVSAKGVDRKCGKRHSWTAWVDISPGKCGRGPSKALLEDICTEGSDNWREQSDYYKIVKGVCSSTCVLTSEGTCVVNPDRIDFAGIAEDDDICPDYCVPNDGSQKDGQCMIGVSHDDLCLSTYEVDMDTGNVRDYCRFAKNLAAPARVEIKALIAEHIETALETNFTEVSAFCAEINNCNLEEVDDDATNFLHTLCASTPTPLFDADGEFLALNYPDATLCDSAMVQLSDQQNAVAAKVPTFIQENPHVLDDIDVDRLCEAAENCAAINDGKKGEKLARENPVKHAAMLEICKDSMPQ